MATLFTVGHGTRTVEELTGLVTAAGVGRIVDVRRYPTSRRHPHFAREALATSLPAAGVGYEWRGEELGGRRSSPKGTAGRHPAWRNDAFRSYADYMDTPSFRDALERLEDDAGRGPPLAIMCAERLWWRCHRRLVADALVVDGHEVVHLIDARTTHAHRPPETMRVDERNRPVYDLGV